MKSPLPVSAADARAVLAALGVHAPTLERDAYEVAELVGASAAVTLVAVHKRDGTARSRGCMAELTDLRTGDRDDAHDRDRVRGCRVT